MGYYNPSRPQRRVTIFSPRLTTLSLEIRCLTNIFLSFVFFSRKCCTVLLQLYDTVSYFNAEKKYSNRPSTIGICDEHHRLPCPVECPVGSRFSNCCTDRSAHRLQYHMNGDDCQPRLGARRTTHDYVTMLLLGLQFCKVRTHAGLGINPFDHVTAPATSTHWHHLRMHALSPCPSTASQSTFIPLLSFVLSIFQHIMP